MAKVRYFFSKIESFPDYESAKIEENLLRLLQSSAEINTYGENHYRFLLSQEYTVNGKKYAFSQLTRYAHSEVGIVDENSNQEGGQRINNLIQGRNRFYIHLESGLIAHTLKDGVTIDTFENILSELLFASSQKLGLDINRFILNRLNKEDYDFKTELNKFISVRRLEIKLRPSNPHSDDEWADIDERLHELKSKRYRESYSNDAGELNIKDDDEIRRKIIMAHKYGDAIASGIDENQKFKVIRISKDQREFKVDDTLTPDEVIERLAPVFVQLSLNQ